MNVEILCFLLSSEGFSLGNFLLQGILIIIDVCFIRLPINTKNSGTENFVVAFLQTTLRHVHHDAFAGDQSFQYGKSTANQVYE